MPIRLNDRFTLRWHTVSGWVLEETLPNLKKDAKNPYWTDITYPGRLSVALKRVIEKYPEDCNSAQQLLDRLNEIHADIMAAIPRGET